MQLDGRFRQAAETAAAPTRQQLRRLQAQVSRKIDARQHRPLRPVPFFSRLDGDTLGWTMPKVTFSHLVGVGSALAVGLSVLAGAGTASAYDARLDGRWTLQPGKCRLQERASTDRRIGFPTEMRLRGGRLAMKNGGCRFTGFKAARVKNVWSVRLACKDGDQKWTSSYVYVLRGKRLAVIDGNGLAVSYMKCP